MTKHIYALLTLLLILSACASGQVYHIYGLALPPQAYDQGQLLGHQGDGGWPDLPFNQCKPDAVRAGKCVVLFTDDFFAMRRELLELRQSLQNCQRGPQPASN